MLEESVYVVPLVSEIDTFVHTKLDTPKKKVQLKVNFYGINGKFQFLNLYKIMLFVMKTVFEIEPDSLSYVIFSVKVIS